MKGIFGKEAGYGGWSFILVGAFVIIVFLLALFL